jgi:hypothetical protein
VTPTTTSSLLRNPRRVLPDLHQLWPRPPCLLPLSITACPAPPVAEAALPLPHHHPRSTSSKPPALNPPPPNPNLDPWTQPSALIHHRAPPPAPPWLRHHLSPLPRSPLHRRPLSFSTSPPNLSSPRSNPLQIQAGSGHGRVSDLKEMHVLRSFPSWSRGGTKLIAMSVGFSPCQQWLSLVGEATTQAFFSALQPTPVPNKFN